MNDDFPELWIMCLVWTVIGLIVGTMIGSYCESLLFERALCAGRIYTVTNTTTTVEMRINKEKP